MIQRTNSLARRVVAIIRPQLDGCRCAERLLDMRASAIAQALINKHQYIDRIASQEDNVKIMDAWANDGGNSWYTKCRAGRSAAAKK